MFCIPISYLCNFYNDCPGGADEQNCSTSKSIHRLLTTGFQFVYIASISC